jgi:hypothetical protein
MGYYRLTLNKIHAALSLSLGDWGIFINAWFWLLVIDLLLRTRPYPHVNKFMENQRKIREEIPSGQAWETIRRTQRLVILAARNHLYRMQCLRQALVLKGILGAKGIFTELRFGVNKTEEQFLAHAWLEYEGQSIDLTDRHVNYKPLKALENRR